MNEQLEHMTISKEKLLETLKLAKKMESTNPKKWKKIIELIIAILTVIGSFIGGNVTAKNTDFKIKEIINQEISK